MEYNGERMVPGTTAGPTEHQHWQRYRFAAEFVREKRVIDMGCGCGYGCDELTAVAFSVTGIDNSVEAIEYAKQHHGKNAVYYHVQDAENLTFNAGDFDVAVCFEVLEHLGDPAAALAEMQRVLVDDGLLIASTPNKRGSVRGRAGQPQNPWHRQEWTPEEFLRLIEPCFAVQTMLGQAQAHDWEPRVEAWGTGYYAVVVAQARR